MKLEQLMEGVPYTLVQGSPETEINDIIYDSRKAAPGLLFVCIVGTQRDSHEFAADCAAKGVSALVIQHDIDLTHINVLEERRLYEIGTTDGGCALHAGAGQPGDRDQRHHL